MSENQKPARMRVVGSSGGAVPTPATPVPQRRRGDAVVVDAEPASPAGSASGRSTLMLAGLFILGCAIGGAVLPWTGLIG